MLSPSRSSGGLNRQEQDLLEVLGCSETEYEAFCREVARYSRLRPGEPVAFLPAIAGLGFWGTFALNLAIGVTLTGIAALLAPKAPKPANPPNAPRNVEGQSIVDNAGFTPKTGFDGLQNVVEMGSPIPLVFAKREEIDGIVYGGVRINTNLVWSEVLSIKGGQMLRAMFMLGEGPLPTIDPMQIAIGNNLLNSYVFEKQTLNDFGRVTYYFSGDGGRLTPADYIGGRNPANDEGNAAREGADDVFMTRAVGDDSWRADFSNAFRPSTQTQFGLFAPIGNGLTFLVNPRVSAGSVATFVLVGGNLNPRVIIQCKADPSERARRAKQEARFNSRANFLGNDNAVRAVEIGDRLTYTVSSRSDKDQVFTYRSGGEADGSETCGDVASSVANRSRAYDDRLVIGELYKLGTAYLTLVDRSDWPFSSDADGTGSGRPITATFKVVSPGVFITTQGDGPGRRDNRYHNGTNTSHLFRVARASFVTERPCRIVEIGIRSAVGLRFGGLMNFRDSWTYYEADGKACDFYNQEESDDFVGQRYNSGTYTGPEERYSFFRIYYRKAGTMDNYRSLSRCYGVRSLTQAATYNSIRMLMPDEQRWEFLLEPLSGWEIRTGFADGDLEVLDWREDVRVVWDTECELRYNGAQVPRSPATFELRQGINKQGSIGSIYVPLDGTNYIDAWGKLAEVFPYEEIQANVDQPEHEIVYINQVTANDSVPQYNNIATLGMNLRSSVELTQMEQISVYITEGLGNTHLFPDVLKLMLTQPRWGLGNILSPEQVDTDSMAEAATWTHNRRYFYDGGVSEPLNVISWASETARRFLLDFVYKNGIYSLKPAVTFDGPEPITGMYDSGNIVEGSFKLTYLDPNDRQPPRISVRWRKEAGATGDPLQRGLFPQVQELSVQETDVPPNAPLESIDVSSFCTSEKHATDIAKYECRFRRLVTHGVEFQVMPSDARLDLATCFRLSLEMVASSVQQVGTIDADGRVRTYGFDLPDGTHSMVVWSGDAATSLTSTKVTVTNGIADSRRGSVFALERVASTVSNTYKVQSLSFSEEGLITVNAIYWPTDEAGYSLISKDWDSGFTVSK